MNINEIHQFFNRLTDKEIAGYFTTADIDNFLDRASMMWFNKWRMEYAISIEAQEALVPFKTILDYTTNGSGVYAVASNQNYISLLSIDVSVLDGIIPRRWPVKVMKEDEIAARRNSQLLTPSLTAPIAEETASGSFTFYPTTVHAGTIRFFRRPAKPVLAGTIVERVFTYDSGTSTQLEWTEPYQNKIILSALQLAGVNLNDQVLQQAGIILPQQNV
jgi:hypothetical protein